MTTVQGLAVIKALLQGNDGLVQAANIRTEDQLSNVQANTTGSVLQFNVK